MLKSFEELSQDGLNYQEFETIRQEAHAKSKKGLMIGGIIGGTLVVVGIILFAVSNPAIGFFTIFIGAIIFGIYYAIVNSKAKKQVKEKVLGDLLKSIDPTFNYSKGDREFVPNFRKAGFVKSTSAVHVDDVFIGQINGLQFSLGELKVTRQQGKNKHITVYQGPFAFTTTSANYGFTSIIPDTMEKSLGGIGKLLQKADISRLNQKNIRIDEDPDFERTFAVWTKDETTTRQILNPEFRSYLTGLATLSRTYIGWRDNNIYFGMDNRRDLFNLKLKNVISQSTVRQFYDDFAQYYNILENIISFVTTGIGAESSTNINSGDVPPPPAANNNEYYGGNQNETPPPPPSGNTTPPPPPKPKF
ncbi:MAG: DUF3137 domain-containing protein [Bacteroidales bacterium]|nr:DUF3137 domain-containing protein [Bacteroidales bacterium]